MKLLERFRRHTGGPEITALICDCGSPVFHVELRWSYSAQKYEQFAAAYGQPQVERPPDTLMVVCDRCGNEIIITSTSGQMPPANFWRNPDDAETRDTAYTDAILRHLKDQLGMPPEHMYGCDCPRCFRHEREGYFRYNEEPWH